MPDRLGDALNNSERPRHHLVCPKCSHSVIASTPIGARFAMRLHRKHQCEKIVRKEKVVDNSYGNLLAQLRRLSEMLTPPLEHMRALALSDMHGSIVEAKSGIESAMESVPLPADHGSYQLLTGAMGHAAGMVDGCGDIWSHLRDYAGDAASSIEETQHKIATVIAAFNSAG